MRERSRRIEQIGATVIGVGTRESHQAQRLLDDGIPFPLLLDPGNEVRRAVGIADAFSWRNLLHPRGAAAYVRAVRQAGRFDPVWNQATQRPAVLVLDADMSVTWSHLGVRIGDYPSVDECLGQLARAAGP